MDHYQIAPVPPLPKKKKKKVLMSDDPVFNPVPPRGTACICPPRRCDRCIVHRAIVEDLQQTYSTSVSLQCWDIKRPFPDLL